MTATIAFCSSIHTAAITSVAQAFDCSRTIATLGVTTFLLGFGSGPLIFAPLSEIYGRNQIYRITLLLFFLFNIGCALSPNIAALLVFRFLCGFFGSPTGKLPLTAILKFDSCPGETDMRIRDSRAGQHSHEHWWFHHRYMAA